MVVVDWVEEATIVVVADPETIMVEPDAEPLAEAMPEELTPDGPKDELPDGPDWEREVGPDWPAVDETLPLPLPGLEMGVDEIPDPLEEVSLGPGLEEG